MKCNEVENKIIPFLEGDLDTQQEIAMKEHLASCEQCQRQVAETQQMLEVFNEVEDAVPSDRVRGNFIEFLEEEKSLQRYTIGRKETKEFPWKMAFQIAASVLILIAGYAWGSFQKGSENDAQIAELRLEATQLKQDMMLAMLDNRSVSKRIQAVNYTEDIAAPDEEVLEALIDRLHFDGNVNVRLAAVEALSRYSENEKVKDAFIKSLTNETNPNIQIAVIQFLVDVQEKRALAPMQKLLEHTETPNFVKDRANEGIITLM
ncbi:HEAT repeat domain-containing protein [Aureisphaera galaxeae]|uniref:HEAT repeat domain-containing protein n=1 Tax=Aureisphaera galaxeae TaxID=1538023 RepID=UPI00234FDAEE|nr:HEAT repeat domain-containing protein [Aureisphaera galaxeae]MDC8002978.1 HEAT repeat domain-containing protein [Aureisphaera galaxeae]